MSFEKWLALMVAVACGLLLVRMALPVRWRQRVDSAVLRALLQARHQGMLLWQWRQRRQARADARRTAEAVIDRARRAGRQGAVQRDGNVLTPDSFQRPRKPH